jgi:hypothetical protein
VSLSLGEGKWMGNSAFLKGSVAGALAFWDADFGAVLSGSDIVTLDDFISGGVADTATATYDGSQKPLQAADDGGGYTSVEFLGQAASLGSHWMEVTSSADIDSITSAFTYCYWFKCLETVSYTKIFTRAGASLAFYVDVDPATGNKSIVLNGSLGNIFSGAPVSAWHHYAWTFDGSLTGGAANVRVKCFLDGVDQGISTNSSNPAALSSSTVPFKWGCTQASGQGPKLRMDCVGLYNRALTAAEILTVRARRAR